MWTLLSSKDEKIAILATKDRWFERGVNHSIFQNNFSKQCLGSSHPVGVLWLQRLTSQLYEWKPCIVPFISRFVCFCVIIKSVIDINRCVHLAFLILTKWKVVSSYVTYVWYVSCHSLLPAQIPRWVERSICFHDNLKLTMQLEHSQLACDVLLRTDFWLPRSMERTINAPSEERCSVFSTGKLELKKPGWKVTSSRNKCSFHEETEKTWTTFTEMLLTLTPSATSVYSSYYLFCGSLSATPNKHHWPKLARVKM